MASNAIYAGNTVLKRNGTPIAEGRSYSFKRTANFIPTTPFKSDRYEEGLVGIITATLDITVNWKFGSHSDMNDDFEGGVSTPYSIEFPSPDSSTLSFDAIVLDITVTGAQGAEQSGSIQMRLDGAPSWS